jgi:small subunit ribosomal protein S9
MADEPETPEENEPSPGEESEQPPTPEAEEPTPAPEAEEPTPAPEAEEPAPAPEAEEEAPAPEAEEQPAPAAEEPAAEEPAAEEPTAEEPAAEEPAAAEPAPEAEQVSETPRAKPEIPGADLEVDIVPEGYDPLAREEAEAEAYDAEGVPITPESAEEDRPVPQAAIDLAAGARYGATGKRKTAIARVVLKPGKGEYLINGRALDAHFPRPTLQRNIRQPLEAVGYESRMDVVATLHGGGVSAQAGALRHGISRALIEADPNLRGELKRRGFLTRDPRVKERKKAGLKKARKRPQFSKR